MIARRSAGPLGITAVLVDTAEPGFVATAIPTVGLRAARLSEITMTGVRVPADRLLGRQLPASRRGMQAVVRVFNQLRPGVAALAVGTAAAAADYVRAHAGPLDPVRADRLAELERRTAAVRQLVHSAAAAVDADPASGAVGSAAKARAVRLAEQATLLAPRFSARVPGSTIPCWTSWPGTPAAWSSWRARRTSKSSWSSRATRKEGCRMPDDALRVKHADRDEHRRRIRRLAIPIMLAALTGVGVQFATMALLGRISDQALYVRSLYLPVAFLIIALQEALDVATQVSVAITRGRGDISGTGPLAASFLRLGYLMMGAACVLIAALAPALARLLSASPADNAVFVSFVRWSALASLASVAPIVLAAVLRGWGKASSAAAVTMTNATVQVGGVALLGFGTGLGVYSVPWAILGGALAGLALGLIGWRRHGLPRVPLLAWRREAAIRLGVVGGPVAVSYLLLFGSNLGLLWILGPFGPLVVSGFAAAYTVQTVTIVPAIALGSATAIVMNQLRGQGHGQLLPSVFRSGLRLALWTYLPAAAVVWLARGLLADIATRSPLIAAQTERYLTVVGPTLALMGLVLVAVTVLEQLGAGVISIAANLLYFGVIIAVGGVLARHARGPADLYATIAITNTLGGPLTVITALATIRHRAANRPARVVADQLVPASPRGPAGSSSAAAIVLDQE